MLDTTFAHEERSSSGIEEHSSPSGLCSGVQIIIRMHFESSVTRLNCVVICIMEQVSGLVPSRFLLLTSHLLVSLTIYLSRDENVLACLPLHYQDQDYARMDLLLSIGLLFSLVLLLFEMAGFLAGISTFVPSVTIVSIIGHAAASIALSFFALDVWECGLFWVIFVFCSVLPASAEFVLMIGTLRLNNTPPLRLTMRSALVLSNAF
ncbi:hypothetical protein TCAL_17235 [Tigriopus californicus]|uniref:Transmembrane protein 107 n=1 Tax=Tigriopus californicus TaxID=6832 RepID=A0A553N6U2_TIGCA|nr:hypothetical protein TCAL_17235 [Tigriopus californicus]